jgi:hypothetical protein
MTSDQGKRISLEVFQRHFLLTHLKGNSERFLNQLESRAHRSGESFADVLAELVSSSYDQTAFQDDEWYVREIDLDSCYCAHADFRLFPVPKNER